MKESKRQGRSTEREQSWEREASAEKQSAVKSVSDIQSAAAFAAALSQGMIPHTLEPRLFSTLSSIGNYSFLQALENKENIDKVIKSTAEREVFNREKKDALLEMLAQEFGQQANRVEVMPEIQKDEQIPNMAANDTAAYDTASSDRAYISALTPVSFDQGAMV